MLFSEGKRRAEPLREDHVTITEPTPDSADGTLTEPPSRVEMDDSIRLITDNATRVMTWKYDRDRTQLVTLYNKAMASQWNSVTDLDWQTDVDPEKLVMTNPNPTQQIVAAATKIKGSPIASWGEKELAEAGIEFMKASLSQFMHGEQGAMMTAAKIVETVPWIDAKYYASTQTMDEARHTEVFAKYLHEKLGEAYPMNPFLDAQIMALLEDSRWDIAYLGMQIIIESLALAAFGDMLRRTEEPLLRKLLRYVMADEARHVAFGIISLGEFYENLSENELKDRQEFMIDNTLRQRSRSTTPEVWDRLGVNVDAVIPYLREGAMTIELDPRAAFQRGFFAKLVPNTRRLGLLDANNGYLRKKWGEAGLMEFEFADDTASDYEQYDAVAQDRAAVTT